MTPERWDDLEALFGRSGASGGCWCMYWRTPRKNYDRGAGNKAALRTLTDELCARGLNPGLLAYAEGAPVGWISLGPRGDYHRFAATRSTTFVSPDDTPVWSVVCFFVKGRWRHKGVAGALLAEAIAYARVHGATLLEAYPTDVEAPTASANLFMGTQALFAKAGFVEVARHKPERPIMRLAL